MLLMSFVTGLLSDYLGSDDIVDTLDSAAHHGEEANVAKCTVLAFFRLTRGVTLSRRRRIDTD